MGENASNDHGCAHADTWRAQQFNRALTTAWQLSESRWRGEGRQIFIGASAGDGKNTVCSAFAEQHPDRVHHIQLDRTGGSKHAIHLGAINLGIGVKTTHNHVLASVVKKVSPKDILIFQDVHSIRQPAHRAAFIEYCIGLSDTTGCTVVTSVTLSLFTTGLKETDYADEQYWGRCADMAIITKPAESDYPSTKKAGALDPDKFKTAMKEWDDNLDSDIRKIWEFHCPEVNMTEPLFNAVRGLVTHPRGTMREVYSTIMQARNVAEDKKKPFNTELCRATALVREERIDRIERVMGRRK